MALGDFTEEISVTVTMPFARSADTQKELHTVILPAISVWVR